MIIVLTSSSVYNILILSYLTFVEPSDIFIPPLDNACFDLLLIVPNSTSTNKWLSRGFESGISHFILLAPVCGIRSHIMYVYEDSY